MKGQSKSFTHGIDWSVVVIYFTLVFIGVLSIYAVEFRDGDPILKGLFPPTKNYGRQVLWVGICTMIALFIWLTDSKFFTAMANLIFGAGILLLVVTLFIGKNVKGSHSWLVVGGFQFQPAELCKVAASLALAKYISRVDTNFTKFRSQLIAAGIVLLPAVITIAQKETGLALVYFSFFLVMYREGLPVWVLILGFSLAVLVVATLLIEKNLLAYILTGLAVFSLFALRRKIRRKKSIILMVLSLWVFCVGIQRFAVPYFFEEVLEGYQVRRIYSAIGKDYIPPGMEGEILGGEIAKRNKANEGDYNVKQSKIAIGSGGIFGSGYLKGTQTRYDFVPEQSTDFIFCTIGEGFGFVGSSVLMVLYLILLFRIVVIAERQRSVFSRVYAYSVASIFFFHFAINILMTIGLAPVIGIPLPLISYGGSSLLTFTILIFIMLRLDADRQMVLR